MSWEQVYHIERVIDFAYGLYGNSYDEFLKEIFEKVIGKKVVKIEDIILIDDPWYGEGKGRRITFEGGDIYIHKLVAKYTSGGNYGCDTYRLIKKDEKVKVKETNEN